MNQIYNKFYIDRMKWQCRMSNFRLIQLRSLRINYDMTVKGIN